MIVLDNAGTRALSLINTQNGANVEVNFSDYTTSTGAYARGVPTLTTISSGTTTSICATPASGVIRDIDYVNIYNTFAGAQNFTVQITSGSGGPFVLVFATLAQNESLNYTHGSGWCALDANGNRKESTGTVLASLTVTGNATIGGTLGVTGATTLAALTVSGAIVGAVTQSLLNTVSTTVNFAGGASVALNMGNASGTNTVLGATTFSQALTGSTTLSVTGNVGLKGGGTTTAMLEVGGTMAAISSAAKEVHILHSTNPILVIGKDIGDYAYMQQVTGSPSYFQMGYRAIGDQIKFIDTGLTTIGGASNYGLAVNGALTASSTITATGGATFFTTSTALTDGAGAGAGTILNAPAAGNPTKWIGINDNGTTRYIPAW